MNHHSRRASRPPRLLLAIVLALGVALGCAAGVRAQTVRVEAENYLPNGNRGQLSSGPNGDQTGPNGKDWGIVTVDTGSQFSGGYHIGYYTGTDWLEYDVAVPADGLYTININFASDTTIGLVPVVLTDWTSGEQVIGNVLPTSGYGDYQTRTLNDPVSGNPLEIPMRAGTNRIRLQIRPEAAVNTGSMNVDYIDLVKSGNYDATQQAVTGTVTTPVGTAQTPLAGAFVWEGTDYQTASKVTRTDANGHYTLYLPSGSHTLHAFYNGMSAATQSAATPSNTDISLTYNGRIEAELLDSTNPGYANTSGFEPEYDPNPDPTFTPPARSNNGQLVLALQNKYADYNAIVVPTAGVYDLSMFYTAGTGTTYNGPGAYSFQVNGSLTKTLTYPQGTPNTYQDSPKILLYLNQGLNTIHMVDSNVSPFKYVYANVDYFTLVPSTQTYGTVVVSVKAGSASGPAVSGASVQVTDASNNPVASGVTDASGVLNVPLPPGTYNVSVTKSGASQPGTVTATVTAQTPPGTFPVPIVLDIQGISLEAEAFSNSGPNTPAVTPATDPSMSGGAYVPNLSGFERPEWLEWTFNVPTAGLYTLGMSYAVEAIGAGTSSPDIDVWVPGTTFQERSVDLPNNGPGGWLTANFDAPVPLQAGPNTLRLTMNSGTIDIDYLTLVSAGALPPLQTITGTITGTDGTGTAPLGGAAVFVVGPNPIDPTPTVQDASALAYTDNTGKYTLTIPAGSADLNVFANGFNPAALPGVAGGSTKNATLQTNNPSVINQPAEQVEAELAYLTDQTIQTTEGKVHNAQPGSFFELLVNAPQSGTYRLGMNYGSDWPTPDGRIHMTLTVNGVAGPAGGASVPRTGDYNTMTFLDDVASVNLNAGPNTLRVTFTDGVANIDFLTLTRTGGIVINNPTDINNSGKTDIVDAVLYARRLAGLDTGPTPDLNGDSVSNAKDVQTILKVAGGLS